MDKPKTEATLVLSKDTPYYLLHLNQNRKIWIYDGFVIGRSEGNENFPSDALLSRKHLKLHVQNNTVLVEDLNSRNHTKINSKVITPSQKIPILHDQIIEVGNQRFQLKDHRRPEISTILQHGSSERVQESNTVPILAHFLDFTKCKNWDATSKFLFLLMGGVGVVTFHWMNIPILDGMDFLLWYLMSCSYLFFDHRRALLKNSRKITRMIGGFIAVVCITIVSVIFWKSTTVDKRISERERQMEVEVPTLFPENQ